MNIAVDFDGTLCENKYPEIGKPKYDVINKVLECQKKGATIILWTCRTGEDLKEAVKWCWHHRLYPDYVNENPPAEVERWHNDPRKIGATYYLDDKAIGVDDFLRMDLI